jgi:hypothetical protein
LEEAIRKADILYQDVDRKWVAAAFIAGKWEQSATSGGFMVALAALKQFGLIEDEGKGPSRKFRLRDLALEIILHKDDQESEGAERRKQALKRAALLPKIHAEIWEKFHGFLPTQDNAIRVYLLKGRKEEGKGEPFNKDSVDSLIRQFRSTVAFAELDASDKIPSADEDVDSEAERVPMEKTMPQRIAPAIAVPSDTATNRVGAGFTPQPTPQGSPFIHLPIGQGIEVRLGARLSNDEFEAFLQILKLSKASLIDPGDPHKIQREAAKSAARHADHPDPDGGRGSGGIPGHL